MKYLQLIRKYSAEMYSIYSKDLKEGEWGNEDVAKEYLYKYYLSEDNYLRRWQPIQDQIFYRENIGLPEVLFRESFSMAANRGGVLFEQEDFEKLKKCALELGDENIVIIQNDFDRDLNVPPLRMKFPVDISWIELMSGNFISTVLFEMFSNEYFVFSESGTWGKYSANDYEHPLDIIGFKPEYEQIFKGYFSQPPEEWEEIKEWLPPKYKKIIR